MNPFFLGLRHRFSVVLTKEGPPVLTAFSPFTSAWPLSASATSWSSSSSSKICVKHRIYTAGVYLKLALPSVLVVLTIHTALTAQSSTFLSVLLPTSSVRHHVAAHRHQGPPLWAPMTQAALIKTQKSLTSVSEQPHTVHHTPKEPTWFEKLGLRDPKPEDRPVWDGTNHHGSDRLSSRLRCSERAPFWLQEFGGLWL